MSKKKYIKVWRLEDHNGDGVFCGGYIHRVCINLNKSPLVFDNPQTHPNPNNDNGMNDKWKKLYRGGRTDCYVFGFKTLKQYKKWFNKKFRDALTDIDEGAVRLNQYKVKVTKNSVIIGDKQVAFIKSEGTIISTRKPNEVK